MEQVILKEGTHLEMSHLIGRISLQRRQLKTLLRRGMFNLQIDFQRSLRAQEELSPIEVILSCMSK